MMVWRSGYQIFLIFDGVLTAGLAAMVGLVTATFIHKDWTISGWWNVFGVILAIGVIATLQRFVHKDLDSMPLPDGKSDDERIKRLPPDGESDDERIKRLLREVLNERPGEA